MIPVQVRELKAIDGDLTSLVSYHNLHTRVKGIPRITSIITKSFFQLLETSCRHLYSFHALQRYKFRVPAFLFRENTLFQSFLVLCNARRHQGHGRDFSGGCWEIRRYIGADRCSTLGGGGFFLSLMRHC